MIFHRVDSVHNFIRKCPKFCVNSKYNVWYRIEEASNNGKLHIGVSGINKKDKNLIVVPVNVKN